MRSIVQDKIVSVEIEQLSETQKLSALSPKKLLLLPAQTALTTNLCLSIPWFSPQKLNQKEGI